MAADLPLLRAIARWVTAVRAEAIAPARRHRMQVALLDFLACAHAGSTLPEAADARVLARPGALAVPGLAQRLDEPSAIVAWGTLGALLQWHDGYGRGGNHPSSSILPVLLAGSEDWHGMLMPALVGYEVANRLAAATHPHQTLAGSAPTSTMGAIGAAAALCRREGLDEDTTVRALGLAGFWAPVAAFEGLRARGQGVPLHSGLAARAGWEAVQAARAGLAASEHLLEGADGAGLLSLLGGPDSVARLADPATWRGETLDQVYLKPFPGCRHVHPAVEAALGLRGRLALEAAAGNDSAASAGPAAWSAIEVRTYGVALGFAAMPRAGAELYDCLMSLPWCVALALLEGTPDLTAVAADRARPALWSLAQRVQLRADPAHQAAYPGCLGATVAVTLPDGRVLTQDAVLRYAEAATSFSPAGPFGPVLDEAGVLDKFMRLTASRGSEASRQAMAHRILDPQAWQRELARPSLP